MEAIEKIINNIERLRKYRSMTIKELAFKSDLSQGGYNQVLKRRSISLINLIKICQALEVDISTVVDSNDPVDNKVEEAKEGYYKRSEIQSINEKLEKIISNCENEIKEKNRTIHIFSQIIERKLLENNNL